MPFVIPLSLSVFPRGMFIRFWPEQKKCLFQAIPALLTEFALFGVTVWNFVHLLNFFSEARITSLSASELQPNLSAKNSAHREMI